MATDHPEAIGAILRRRDPDDVLLVTGAGEEVTAGECLERTADIVGELVAAGVRAGDRVAVLHDLSAPALLLWWALGRLGAVYLPLNPTGRHGSRAGWSPIADRR